MKCVLNIMAVCTVGAIVASCGPKVEVAQVSAELPVTEARQQLAGDSWVYLNKISGKEEISRTLAVEGNVVSGVNETTGCSYSYIANSFAPPMKWENCTGNTGSSKITGGEGAIFPLAVGNTASWSADGSNDKGDTWDDARSCKVEGTARVTVPAGAFDTYHITCQTSYRSYNYYYSPELGTTVLLSHQHKNRNEPRHRELVSFTPATSS